MDNKPFEMQAEAFATNRLLRAGLKLTKPSFDILGADFVLLGDMAGNTTPFVKVQIKGRTLNNDNSVEIPASYVVDNFVVFIYLQWGESGEELLVFFRADLERWPLSNGRYRLRIPKGFHSDNYFLQHRYGEGSAEEIRRILFGYQPVKKFNSMLIDGVFLKKAIHVTVETYSEIYPERAWDTPRIGSLLTELSRYAGEVASHPFNCFLIESMDIPLGRKLIWDESPTRDEMGERGIEHFHVDPLYDLFRLRTSEIVLFKMEEQLERIINTENVLFVADDPGYNPYLQALYDRKMTITIAQLKGDFGSRMQHNFRYFDIMYPIGRCLGLAAEEL
jgi:hypothetical protein